MSPLMYGSRSGMAAVIRCGACGRPAGPRLAIYPSEAGAPLCGHCAYASGALSGRERGKYIRRQPLRAAVAGAQRMSRRAVAVIKRWRVRWKRWSRKLKEQEKFLCPHGRVVCGPMIGADACKGHTGREGDENLRAWKEWEEEFDRRSREELEQFGRRRG